MQKLNNKQQSYYVTATVSTHNNNREKIYISTESIKNALSIEHELYNHKTLEIMNVRFGKSRPKSKKGYIEISGIDELKDIN